jgi:4-hydroxyacetophenone monooxygenase
VSGQTDDTALEAALDDADLPALIAALAEHLGDLSLLRDELHIDAGAVKVGGTGWTADQEEIGRRLALDALRTIRDRQPEPVPRPDQAGRLRMLEWIAAEQLSPDMATLLSEELGLDGDLRGPTWQISGESAPAVAVIGAGMSGILAAHRLSQAGVEVTVLEKNSDVGGTWFENVYPGCRVDVPNHVYAYSNAQKADWPFYHSPQSELLDYFRECAVDWGIRDLIRFDTEVESLAWDETANEWLVIVQDSTGESQLRVNAVVSAVGQLNHPKLPDIAGRERFKGRSFHTARWPADIDLEGQRIAVIGTGASAMQAIPEIAPAADHTTVFQRTPAWLIPRPMYHDPLPEGLLRLFDLVPSYSHWFRLRRFWEIHHGSVDAMRRDPDWTGPLERSVSASSEFMREVFASYIEGQFAERPDLLEQVMPQYPVGAKRAILDNGIWAETLMGDDVELITESIDEITETGVRAGGRHHEADVVIYSTGFTASSFLTPMSVKGRGGVDLHETWGNDARAYLGLTVPGFPNFFCLYGPNTNIVFNGSIIYFSECGVRYITEAIHQMDRDGLAAMDLRSDVHQRQLEKVDAANAEMAWGLSSVSSWYKSPNGRVAQNWPFPLVDYWQLTLTPDPDDYERW